MSDKIAPPYATIDALPADQKEKLSVAWLKLDSNHNGRLERAEITSQFDKSRPGLESAIIETLSCSTVADFRLTPAHEKQIIDQVFKPAVANINQIFSSNLAKSTFPKGIETISIDDIKPMIDVAFVHIRNCGRAKN